MPHFHTACVFGLLLLVLPSTATPQAGKEVHDFTVDVVTSLHQASRALTSINDAADKINASADSNVSLLYQSMTAKRLAIQHTKSASRFIENHTGSQQEMVRDVAKAMQAIYGALVRSWEGELRIDEKMVDLKPGDPMGPLVSESSQYAAMIEDAWKGLPQAVAGVTHAMVDGDRLVNGKLGYLVLTQSQRNDILTQLKLLFDEDVAAGKSKNRESPVVSAMLLGVFLHKGFKCADQP